MNHMKEYENSVHVGEIKKRQEFDIVVRKIILKENEFGLKKIHIINSQGNYLVWFCSGVGLEEGFEGKVKATVQKHEEYNGVPQTVVNRVAIVKEKLI